MTKLSKSQYLEGVLKSTPRETLAIIGFAEFSEPEIYNRGDEKSEEARPRWTVMNNKFSTCFLFEIIDDSRS